jgi:DNA-binding response OmpR family regulator
VLGSTFKRFERLQYMPTPKFRILCTEDDPDTRDLIVIILNAHNCEVVTAASSAESLRLARTQHFDLYLLDNWLAGSSGIELCEELRKFDSKTPILFYSGAASDEDKREARECGAQGYLTKPADGDALAAEVLRQIAGSKLSHANSAGQ